MTMAMWLTVWLTMWLTIVMHVWVAACCCPPRYRPHIGACSIARWQSALSMQPWTVGYGPLHAYHSHAARAESFAASQFYM